MTETVCASCGAPMDGATARRPISAAICGDCIAALAAGSSPDRCRKIMNGIGEPVLLLQPDPRLVYAANDAALALFGKQPREAEGHRGGEVFNCIHSFTAAGCGKDVNCETCSIRAGIVGTFGGTAATGVSATLVIRRHTDIAHAMAISTEPAGEYALVRIDQFEKLAPVT